VRGLECSEGLFNRDKTRAWIKTENFDALLGDDYFDRVEQQITEMVTKAQEADPDRPIHVLDLGSLNERERVIFDKLRAGTDFADLSSSERELIAKAMQGDRPDATKDEE